MSRPDTSYRRIILLSTPVMLSQLSYTAMGIIDTIMVGQVGVVALASVGLGSILFWWLLSLFWGMLAGVNTLVSQAEGANDRPAAGVAFWQGIYLGLFLSVLVFLLWPLAPHLMSWTGASPEVQENATAYMQIRLFGAFGLMLLMACDNFYRGIGRTDVPMWFGFVKVFLNCGANYIFIFGHLGAPAMGAVGAAVGTAIANTVIGIAMFAYLFVRPEFRDVYQLLPRVRFHRRVFRALVVLSLPIGIQTFMEMGGFSVFTAVVARLGDPQLAATDAVIHAWSAAFMIAFSLSVAAQTLVGQCIGAGAPGDARRVTLRILRLGGGIMLALALVYVLLPETLMALFVRAERAGGSPPLRPAALHHRGRVSLLRPHLQRHRGRAAGRGGHDLRDVRERGLGLAGLRAPDPVRGPALRPGRRLELRHRVLCHDVLADLAPLPGNGLAEAGGGEGGGDGVRAGDRGAALRFVGDGQEQLTTYNRRRQPGPPGRRPGRSTACPHLSIVAPFWPAPPGPWPLAVSASGGRTSARPTPSGAGESASADRSDPPGRAGVDGRRRPGGAGARRTGRRGTGRATAPTSPSTTPSGSRPRWRPSRDTTW